MAITKVSPDLLDLDAGITISVADNSDNLTLTSTDADANVAPNLRMYRNSGSPADSDQLGKISLVGRNDNSQDVIYAQIGSQIKDASDGTEDGRIFINSIVAGTTVSRIDMTEGETVFNNDTVDLDFRVESDANANAIFVNGGDDRVTFFNGTTVNAASGTDDGVSHYSDGRTDISRASSQPLNLRRRTDDGVIVNFYKEASGTVTDVGAIGTISGQPYFTGATAGGFQISHLNSTNAVIVPVTAAGANTDATHDIGYSGKRFRNIVLSGQALVQGGATSAPSFAFANDTDTGMSRPTSNAINFVTGGSERMRILSTGQVSFGTSSPLAGSRMFTLASASNPYGFTTQNDATTGTMFVAVFHSNGASAIGSITTSNTATAFNTSSDYRLKENIQPLENGLERLNNLKPVKFDWKEDGTSSEGFIAHEAQEVFSDAVTGKKDGEEMQGMDYGRITPLLVKAIQELTTKLEAAEARITTLEG